VRCELTLSFTDATPLFRENIKYGGILEVISENVESLGGFNVNDVLSRRISGNETDLFQV
jgi:hypothetical protein